MSIVLALTHWRPEPWLEALAACAPQRHVETADTVRDRGAIRYALAWKAAPGVLASFPNLEIIFSLGAGVDHLLSDPTLPDVPIVRIVDSNLTMRMVEWVVLHVLLHHRQHRAYAAQQAMRCWKGLPQWGADEVRVGVMGLGALGLAAARALQSLGFSVHGWSRTAKDEKSIPSFTGMERLPAFLSQTDILVVLLPLTEETRGLIDARLINQLARGGPLGGPVLINAGRGGLQVESDILAALETGALKGASLDVFETEPLPAENPLWAAPNLYITPHVAADSDPLPLAKRIMDQIETYERGGKLSHLVDRRYGY